MAMRNFWVDADIDGRKTSLSGGPQSKEGGMHITLYQRSNGSKIKAVTVNCWADDQGMLHTVVDVHQENGSRSASSVITNR